jgi:hypothetical protein
VADAVIEALQNVCYSMWLPEAWQADFSPMPQPVRALLSSSGLSTGGGGREMAGEAIDFNGCSDILELFPAEALQPVAPF